MDSISKYKVILVGGGTGVGKTTFTRYLSKKLGLSVLEVDDIRIVMQSMVSKGHTLNLFADYTIYNKYNAEQVSLKHREVSLEVCKGLEIIINNHIVRDTPIIIEGDDILPLFANQFSKEDVLSIFLYEDSEDRLRKRIIDRANKQRESLTNSYKAYIDMAIVDNSRIMKEAEEVNLPNIQVESTEKMFRNFINIFNS